MRERPLVHLRSGTTTAVHHGPAGSPSTLPHPLLRGFAVAAPGAPPGAIAVLQVAGLTHLDLAALQRAQIPPALVKQVALAVVHQSVPVRVRPILTTATLAPGRVLTVVAGDLPAAPHDVLVVLQGGSYLAEHLIQARNGATGAVITLPSSLPPGTWALGVEDLAGAYRRKRAVDRDGASWPRCLHRDLV
jgi:hypothetical protein